MCRVPNSVFGFVGFGFWEVFVFAVDRYVVYGCY